MDFEAYKKRGFYIERNLFSADEVSVLQKETRKLMSSDIDGKVMEGHQTSVRSINAPHHHSSLFSNLQSNVRLLELVEEILGGPVYVHQYKINTKQAFNGQSWEWHSDYWFWKKEDGMERPDALTAVIFLDEVNEYNGPMLLVPETQNDELIDEIHDLPYGTMDGGNNWEITTSEKLKYSLSAEYLRKKITSKGISSAKGKAGDVLFFHCNLLHCSSANQSPWDRIAVFISYNLVNNPLKEIASPRPDFMAAREYVALTSKTNF